MKRQFFLSLFFQRLDEWFAAVLGFSAGAYVLSGCLRSVASGMFAYHTKLNLGHPVPISFSSDPLLFAGLVLVQFGIAVFLVHTVGWWGLRHILRRAFPALGWSARDSGRMPGLWIMFLGALAIAAGLVPIIWRIPSAS